MEDVEKRLREVNPRIVVVVFDDMVTALFKSIPNEYGILGFAFSKDRCIAWRRTKNGYAILERELNDKYKELLEYYLHHSVCHKIGVKGLKKLKEVLE